MTVEKPIREPVFKQRIYVVIFLLVTGWVLYATIGATVRNWNKTPEQKLAEMRAASAERDRIAQAKQYAYQSARSNNQTERSRCIAAKMCVRFASVRQDCATAGDFKNCVLVKMGPDANSATAECSDDGLLKFGLAEKVPSAVECFFYENLTP